MKRPFTLLLLLAGWSTAGICQNNVSKNDVLPGPFFKMINTTQERKIGQRFSTVTTARVRPASTFKGGFGVITVDGASYNPFANAKLSAVGNTTQFRIYGKKKGSMHGFYFGPYASYMHYKLESASVPGEFHDNNGVLYKADVKQIVKVNVIGGGLMMGVQGFIKKRVAVDWTILGIGFGSLGIESGIEATNTSDNFDFRNYNDDVDKATFGVEKILPFKKTVEATTVTMGAKVPWPLLHMGVAIGFGYGGMKKLPSMPETPTVPSGTGTGTGH